MYKKVHKFPAKTLVQELGQITRYLKPYSNEVAATNKDLDYLIVKETSASNLEFENQFIEILGLFYSEADPIGTITLLEVNSSPDGLFNDMGTCIFPYQHPLFSKASWASFFSISLSRNIDEWILEFFKGREYTKAYLLEAIALAALNEMQKQIRDTLHVHLPKELKESESKESKESKGYALSYTLTPGSHGLPIASMYEVLKLSGGRKIGISQESEFTLSPLKSLTGMILVGTAFSEILKDECNYCSQKENCLYKI